MTRFHDNGYALRLQDFGDCESHLLCQPLLDLESTGEHLRETGQFGETQYSSYDQSAIPKVVVFWQHTVWDVAYVHLDNVNTKASRHLEILRDDSGTYLPSERNHVMLT